MTVGVSEDGLAYASLVGPAAVAALAGSGTLAEAIHVADLVKDGAPIVIVVLGEQVVVLAWHSECCQAVAAPGIVATSSAPMHEPEKTLLKVLVWEAVCPSSPILGVCE